ncbi:MAG TPA: Cof-type HAD-IIB family hydrolase [Candidatus Stackebrandtia faecavium]|nr:Cof-type HAD-IIB family hydrolase [Candidatus Stackebrandtia faecavium]
MKCPKLVVVDLDGTVVKHSSERQEPSEPVIKALAATLAAGVPVAVATGRPIWGALATARALGLSEGFVSASHGAVHYDLASDAILDAKKIAPADAIRRLSAVDGSLAFAAEHGYVGWRTTPNFERNFESSWSDVVDVDTLASNDTTRLAVRLTTPGVFDPGVRCPRAAELAMAAGLDESVYCQEVGFNGWIDVGPPGVTKATGVAAIADHYGVSAAETVVFGDGGNDLPMFEWAGHAIAMGQAGEEVKTAADEVAPGVDEDGVAVMLGRWFS